MTTRTKGQGRSCACKTPGPQSQTAWRALICELFDCISTYFRTRDPKCSQNHEHSARDSSQKICLARSTYMTRGARLFRHRSQGCRACSVHENFSQMCNPLISFRSSARWNVSTFGKPFRLDTRHLDEGTAGNHSKIHPPMPYGGKRVGKGVSVTVRMCFVTHSTVGVRPSGRSLGSCGARRARR